MDKLTLDFVNVLAETEKELRLVQAKLNRASLKKISAEKLSFLTREEARLSKLIPLMQDTLRNAILLDERTLKGK